MASPSSRKNPEPAPEEASFESILDRLETVVARLEGGDLPSRNRSRSSRRA